MPNIADHHSQNVVKLLVLGNSGTGKSGLLSTLAKDYRVFIADFDNGLDILKDPKVLAPEYRKNVFFETFYDRTKIVAGKALPSADGYKAFVKQLGDWKNGGVWTHGQLVGGESMGGIYSWGPSDVFVIDSATFFGNMCMNEALLLSGHLGQRPTIPDWGTAIDMQESAIETLYNPAVNCNIVVTAHLMSEVDDTANNAAKLFPSFLGKKFPKKAARYFNNVVLLEKTGSGATSKRQLQLTGTFNTDLKVSKLLPAVMEPDLSKLFTLLKTA